MTVPYWNFTWKYVHVILYIYIILASKASQKEMTMIRWKQPLDPLSYPSNLYTRPNSDKSEGVRTPGPPPPSGSALAPMGGSGKKSNNTFNESWVRHPCQVSSQSISQFSRGSLKYEKFTDGRIRKITDERTNDIILCENSSPEPWLRWAKRLAVWVLGHAH